MATKIVVMKDGKIQQIDSPRALYEQPRNMFVAGFIGSPKMNFLDATIIKDREEYILEAAGMRLPLWQKRGCDLEKHTGKQVILGIRPEHIYPDSASLDVKRGYKIEPEIDVAELMGAETFLHFNLGGAEITARVASAFNFQTGVKVNLILDTDQIFLFDKESEKRIY